MKKSLWSKFEKVAAAIRHLEAEGASVKWNARINGQKFGASIHRKYDDTEFLIVTDCINFTSPITPGTVKAFAKKVESAGAHFGLLVSSSEYSDKAFELSAEHPVYLLDSAKMDQMSEEEMANTLKPSPLVYNFRFILLDGSTIHIPQDPPILKHLMRNIVIRSASGDTCPEAVVEEVHNELIQRGRGKPQTYERTFSEGAVMIHPNDTREIQVKAFAFDYRVIPKGELINPDAHYEDHYGVTEASQREELAKRNASADASSIASGFDTILRPKRYYYNPQLRFSYYCEEVRKGRAKIVLVEGFLERGLLQARGTISSSLKRQFVEVTEKSEIARLTKLYDNFSFSDKNLEGRLKVFLSNWDEAESIDDLDLTEEQKKGKKADYFFRGRTIIGELKALYDDTAPKIEKILEPYRDTPEWPLFFGEQTIEKVLQHLPNAHEIRNQIIDSITSTIDSAVENANRQIRTTKVTFGVPDAGGLLIVLNDAVDILSPDLIANRVRKLLSKRLPDKSLRFPHLLAVVVIGGRHYSPMGPAGQGLPILIIPTAAPGANLVEAFIEVFNRKWAEYDRRPLFSVQPEDFSKMTFRPMKETRDARPLTRQDYWSLMYRRDPYLRSFSEDDLLDFGVKAFEEVMTRILLKGAPKISETEMEQISVKWANFLDEVGFRALDMKKFVTKLQGVDEKLERVYQDYQSNDSAA